MGYSTCLKSYRVTISLRSALLILLLQTNQLQLLAADAIGRFEPDCGGVTFHMTKFGGMKAGEELVFRIYGGPLPWWTYLPKNDWKDVYGERCMAANKCEDATRARIWMGNTQPDSKTISGKYEIDFGGQHLEGRFLLKYHKHKPLVICE
jgi:hypothetical protein